jgi:hypothetical protein
MAFGSLEQQSLGEFLTAERAPDSLWIFVHVPKTAGSSIASEMLKARPPYRNIEVDLHDHTSSYWEAMGDLVGSFLSDPEISAISSCSGHFDMNCVARIKSARPASRAFSFVRHPVARVISDYRYQRTPAHPPYRDVIERYPDIYSYLDSPDERDKTAQLLAPGLSTASEVIDFVDSSFSFLGAVEMYPMSFNILSRLWGLNLMPTRHERRTESNADNEVLLDDRLSREIIERNELDIALYRHVRSRLETRRPEWKAMIDESPVDSAA